MELIRKEICDAYADCARLRNKEFANFFEAEKIRNLDFRASESVTPKIAKDLLKDAIGEGYNNFTPDKLDLFPDDCKITIAREGSVCLYFEKGQKELTSEAIDLLYADEMDNVGNEIRFWWD